MRHRYTVTPVVEAEQLRANRRFKASVLAELARKSSKIALTPLIREYVEAICGIHTELRSITDDDVAWWETVVENARRRVADSLGEESGGLRVIARGSEADTSRHIDLSEEVIAARRTLRGKNAVFANFAKRYASGAGAG